MPSEIAIVSSFNFTWLGKRTTLTFFTFQTENFIYCLQRPNRITEILGYYSITFDETEYRYDAIKNDVRYVDVFRYNKMYR